MKQIVLSAVATLIEYENKLDCDIMVSEKFEFLVCDYSVSFWIDNFQQYED